MKDEQVLKNLYAMQALKDAKSLHEFINDWIYKTQCDIAEESAKSVGFGSAYKTAKKILTANKKKNPELAFVLNTSHKKEFIITDKVRAILLSSDAGLPATSKQKDYADRVVAVIKESKKNCKAPLSAPTRAELDTIVKDYKAQPKGERGKQPVYSFGNGLPKVNAEYLMDMLAIYPTVTVFYDTSKKSRSNIFFSFNGILGVLMPII